MLFGSDCRGGGARYVRRSACWSDSLLHQGHEMLVGLKREMEMGTPRSGG